MSCQAESASENEGEAEVNVILQTAKQLKLTFFFFWLTPKLLSLSIDHLLCENLFQNTAETTALVKYQDFSSHRIVNTAETGTGFPARYVLEGSKVHTIKAKT